MKRPSTVVTLALKTIHATPKQWDDSKYDGKREHHQFASSLVAAGILPSVVEAGRPPR